MIVVRYEIEVEDPATGATGLKVIGTESHDNIEEVLLPLEPIDGKPIFFTKKFVGSPDYRWQVQEVELDASSATRTYRVLLSQKEQVGKEFYLPNILRAQRHGLFTLHEWAIVEVEYGHQLRVGKLNGQIRTNKRYMDTLQRLSMPKRRLAIVTRVLSRNTHELIQLIPISSRPPDPGVNTCIDVTSSLSMMLNYNKQSWAICDMIQAVPATRILAPLMRRVSHAPAVRDTAFTNRINSGTRPALRDAIMYAVNAAARVRDTADLVVEKNNVVSLNALVASLTTQVNGLSNTIVTMQKDIDTYEKFSHSEGADLAILRTLFP